MSGWVRVDTRFTTHPKVLDIGPLAEALWLRGLCYAGEHLTDGFIPAAFVRRMGDMNAMEQAERLVESGLWAVAEGGYQIHEYLTWQRSREEAAEISEKRAVSGRKGGLQKASNAQANGKQTPSKLLAPSASKRLADTDTDTDTEKKESLSSERDEKSTASPRSPRRFRLPVDWIPSEDNRTYARDRGMTEAEIDAEAEKFRDHFTGINPEARPGWDASWRQWIGRTLERSRPALRAVNGNGTRPNYFAEKAKRMEQDEQRPANVVEGVWR
jgi:hypothetical protein